jgi:hypothetical protein
MEVSLTMRDVLIVEVESYPYWNLVNVHVVEEGVKTEWFFNLTPDRAIEFARDLEYAAKHAKADYDKEMAKYSDQNPESSPTAEAKV